MCSWGETEKVQIGDRQIPVDHCLAPLVRALNAGGIPTAMSCCGHGEGGGFVLLADGRLLAILPQEAFKTGGFQDMAERFDRRRQAGEVGP